MDEVRDPEPEEQPEPPAHLKPFWPGAAPAYTRADARWQPGVSANPHGQVKSRELRRYIRSKYGEDASVLVDALHSLAFDTPDCPKKVQLECVRELLDRGWGRPAQAIAIASNVPLFAIPEPGQDALLPDLGNTVIESVVLAATADPRRDEDDLVKLLER